jgi:hypothetical protein
MELMALGGPFSLEDEAAGARPPRAAAAAAAVAIQRTAEEESSRWVLRRGTALRRGGRGSHGSDRGATPSWMPCSAGLRSVFFSVCQRHFLFFFVLPVAAGLRCRDALGARRRRPGILPLVISPAGDSCAHVCGVVFSRRCGIPLRRPGHQACVQSALGAPPPDAEGAAHFLCRRLLSASPERMAAAQQWLPAERAAWRRQQQLPLRRRREAPPLGEAPLGEPPPPLLAADQGGPCDPTRAR